MGVGDVTGVALLPLTLSQSVTFRDKKPVYLLQIETNRIALSEESKSVTRSPLLTVYLLQIETNGVGPNPVCP